METNAEFEAAVDHYLDGVEFFSVGPCPGCEGCGLEHVDDIDHPDCGAAMDPHFSWTSCDSCGSTLGGDRHPAHGFIDNDMIHFEVCVDCLMYHANGELPYEE